ncbi:ABC transporter substrate-binding protein [Jiangella mangrovi]|uniref:Peptide/nickel transport system substrate-binding protein n=1 Tax=Jiangella mangrovi TaxID=1524084 RepID=A0A7W9GW35_9ACTN|nr:ABC transporter substrate-binding protein [Jiangella mangrovi]MBB5791130.1 peptide/nickel transport system substrate-binding protein [Jiangella mangrovi]
MPTSPIQSRLIARRTLLRAGFLAAGAVAGAPLLGACGSGSSESSGGGTTGRITLGTTKIMQFDPYLTNTDIHIHSFYTYLLDYPPDGTYEPIPAGAERWELASDGTSVTITLREATYHSGEPVTADDVVTGVTRAQDPDAGFTLAQPTAFIAAATAVDERTVRLDFHQPTPESLVLDWMFAFPLVLAASNTPAALEREPAGSGPFRLADFRRDQRLVLEKNPDFYDDGKPFLDEVEYRFFTDEDALVAGLESGSVDGAAYIGFRHADRLRDRFTMVEGNGRMSLFFMNAIIPPFDNKLLRQALARAIDRNRILEQVNFGIGDPVYTAFMPSSPAFDPAYLDSNGFDLDAAAALLEQSGGGTSAVAGVASGTPAVQTLEIIQADLKKIGFDLEIAPQEEAAYLEALFASELQCTVAYQPNNLQSPSLIARGRQMLTTEANTTFGAAVPPAYVEAVGAAGTAMTPEDQQAAYAALNSTLIDEAWAIGISTVPSLFALDKRITGLVTDARDFVDLTDTKG